MPILYQTLLVTPVTGGGYAGAAQSIVPVSPAAALVYTGQTVTSVPVVGPCVVVLVVIGVVQPVVAVEGVTAC